MTDSNDSNYSRDMYAEEPQYRKRSVIFRRTLLETILVMVCFSLLSGFLFRYALLPDDAHPLNILFYDRQAAIFLFLALFFAFVLVFYYRKYGSVLLGGLDLQANSEPSSHSSLGSMERSLSSEIQTLRKQLERRLKEVEKHSTQLDADEIQSVAEAAVREKLDQEIGGDIVTALGKKVSEQASDYARRSVVRQLIIELFDTSQSRINDHAKTMENSAARFRSIGIFLAFSGIALAAINLLVFYTELAVEAFATDAQNATAAVSTGASSAGGTAVKGSAGGDGNDFAKMLRHLPFTLPFILLTEVLALIMFRYQSKSLEMMRYFSNEVTTLSLRRAGALAIVEHGTQKAIADLAGELIKAERNIIMRKDEKTIEVVQNRDEDAFVKALADKFEGYARRKQKKADDADS